MFSDLPYYLSENYDMEFTQEDWYENQCLCFLRERHSVRIPFQVIAAIRNKHYYIQGRPYDDLPVNSRLDFRKSDEWKQLCEDKYKEVNYTCPYCHKSIEEIIAWRAIPGNSINWPDFIKDKKTNTHKQIKHSMLQCNHINDEVSYFSLNPADYEVACRDCHLGGPSHSTPDFLKALKDDPLRIEKIRMIIDCVG